MGRGCPTFVWLDAPRDFCAWLPARAPPLASLLYLRSRTKPVSRHLTAASNHSAVHTPCELRHATRYRRRQTIAQNYYPERVERCFNVRALVVTVQVREEKEDINNRCKRVLRED